MDRSHSPFPQQPGSDGEGPTRIDDIIDEEDGSGKHLFCDDGKDSIDISSLLDTVRHQLLGGTLDCLQQGGAVFDP